ncbi:hypothetical protein [Streptomyces sp. NPDC005773]|uniref:hypothetical protein n=1 Tax=Streptomyces sp. NPDC005773 TaxID=3364727 RepID=UPI0036C8D4F7
MDRSTEFTFGIPWVMSFFHQDWKLSASTEVEAVSGHFVEELDPESVLLVRRDARLLWEGLPAHRITAVWEGCSETGKYFFNRGRLTDGAELMRQVIEVCDAWLDRRPDTVTLSKADRYEGRELTGQVRSVIEEFDDWLGQEMTEALTECVDRCTPDLAFRLLLQALPTTSATLSPHYLYLSKEQYARLASLGQEFQYGEYVVSDVEYLVDT